MSPTEICISIAARPGRYGVTVHNAGYRALGLDFVYRSCQVTDLPGAIAGVRALGIRGASIAMPFKEAVMELLDELDDAAREVGAVNTVVNERGHLRGHNTDVLAVEAALARVNTSAGERVLVLGTGGVARAVRCALVRRAHPQVVVAARSRARGEAFVAGTTFALRDWAARSAVEADVIIQATPVGMAPEVDDTPVEPAQLARARAVVEIIASPGETRLVREARALGKAVSSGPEFSLDQAAAQFALYTGRPAPLEAMRAALASLG